ncbi:MAG: hypothetical protein K2J32_09255 [Ruminococcus sp.]|nr:hypothetical protein [Ruminococcus sp.]
MCYTDIVRYWYKTYFVVVDFPVKMYVIFVKTGRENVVFRELKKRGFDAILPVKRVFRLKGKKQEIVEKVIFENYVFLRCELTPKLCAEITQNRDIQRILGANDENCVPFLKKQEQVYIESLCNGKFA